MDDGPVNLTAGWAVIWSTNGWVQGQSLLLRTILIGALLVTPGVVLPICHRKWDSSYDWSTERRRR